MPAYSDFIRAHRVFTHPVPAQGIGPNSDVMVSLTEMRRSNPAGPLDTPFIGAATMKVYNVAPTFNAVWVRGEIDWDDDLDIKINVLAV